MSLGVLTPRIDAPVDMVCPVQWLHPLNTGLLSWWLAAPGLMGGSGWMDLCRRNHGILANGAAWQRPQNRVAGYGSVQFDANDDQVTLSATGLVSAAPKSLFFWMNSTTSDSLARVFYSGVTGQTWCALALETGGAISPCNGLDGATTVPHANVTLASSTWYHVGFTYDGAAKATYINGEPVGTVGSDGITFSPTDVVIGRRSDLTNRSFGGYLDDIRLYGRALSATEAKCLYDLSRQFHPGLLNRVRRVTYFVEAAPPAVNRRRRFLIGAS